MTSESQLRALSPWLALGLASTHPQVVFSCPAGVGRLDLTPQNNILFMRVKTTLPLRQNTKTPICERTLASESEFDSTLYG